MKCKIQSRLYLGLSRDHDRNPLAYLGLSRDHDRNPLADRLARELKAGRLTPILTACFCKVSDQSTPSNARTAILCGRFPAEPPRFAATPHRPGRVGLREVLGACRQQMSGKRQLAPIYRVDYHLFAEFFLDVTGLSVMLNGTLSGCCHRFWIYCTAGHANATIQNPNDSE